jgi:hypothetical protein
MWGVTKGKCREGRSHLGISCAYQGNSLVVAMFFATTAKLPF